MAELERVMAPKHYAKLTDFLDAAEARAKKYITRQSKTHAIQQKLVNLDYEQFYQYMLDAMIYGTSDELAFSQALKAAPWRSDKGSSKEFVTTNEGAIENYAEIGAPAHDGQFKMDFEKLRRTFAELLLQERMKNIKLRKGRLTVEDERKACTIAAEDMAILDLVVEGLTDAEIVDRMEMTCTRQAVTMRRSRIMELAKEHFVCLIDS